MDASTNTDSHDLKVCVLKNPIHKNKIQKSKVATSSTSSEKDNKLVKIPQYKKLYQQRLLEYNEARKRIFNLGEIANKDIPLKVLKIRKRHKKVKIYHNLINETVFQENLDNRPYAKILLHGKEITGLLDSGASISCL